MKMPTAAQVDVILAKREFSEALSEYCWIQAHVRRCDVGQNLNFQHRFNNFYKVRRNADWRTEYFILMQRAKGTGITFREALDDLRMRSNRIEGSFVSKLVATLDPTKPVIDRWVLFNFGLHRPYAREPDERFDGVIKVYEQLSKAYDDLLNSSTCHMICSKFATRYPWANISDLKRVDLVLWQHR